jgi:hypothetical protein
LGMGERRMKILDWVLHHLEELDHLKLAQRHDELCEGDWR